MAEVPMLRGGANTTRFDDYIRAMLTKDWAALTTILTNTGSLLQNSLSQLKAIALIVQQNATAAAESDADATTKAAAADASAVAAKTSETNAGLSESQASTLATQCTQIKSDVTDMKNLIDAGLRSFARTWLGDLAEDPTQDQFGNALTTGAEYYNTTNKVIRIYTSDGKWEDVSADAQAATLNAQQILQQCQQLEAQIQEQYNTIMAQIGVAIRNDYGLATGKYGLYAGLWDTTYTALGGAGAIAFVYKDTNNADVWGFLASQGDLTAEVTARTASDTTLQNSISTISDNYVSGILGMGTGDSQVVGHYYQGATGNTAAVWKNSTGTTTVLPLANLTDVTSETSARTAADTVLENEKVNRAGDVMNGSLQSTWFRAVGVPLVSSDGSTTNYGTFVASTTDTTTASANTYLQEQTGSQFKMMFTLNVNTTSFTRSVSFGQTGRVNDTGYGDIAYLTDVTTETSARTAADAVLENEKVNRSGDTMASLIVDGRITLTSTDGTSSSYIYADPIGSWGGGDFVIQTGGAARFYIFQATGQMFSALGNYALASQVTAEQNARAAADTVLENEKVNRSGDRFTGMITVPWMMANETFPHTDGGIINYGIYACGISDATHPTANYYLQYRPVDGYALILTLNTTDKSRSIEFNDTDRCMDTTWGYFAYASDLPTVGRTGGTGYWLKVPPLLDQTFKLSSVQGGGTWITFPVAFAASDHITVQLTTCGNGDMDLFCWGITNAGFYIGIPGDSSGSGFPVSVQARGPA